MKNAMKVELTVQELILLRAVVGDSGGAERALSLKRLSKLTHLSSHDPTTSAAQWMRETYGKNLEDSRAVKIWDQLHRKLSRIMTDHVISRSTFGLNEEA